MSITVRFTDSRGTEHDTGFCDRNLNLLAHAQTIELESGSRCGGHGVCGGDRIQTSNASQLSPLTEAEREHLTPEELRAGWRLACQCFPDKSDQLIRVKLSDRL
jgi:ferredoxin